MTVEQLQSLIAYSRWANARLLKAAAALSADERERDLRGSFGSLHETLAHILWGERGWLHHWQEGAFLPDLVPGEYADLASLQGAWAQHESAYADYLHGLTQEDLKRPHRVEGHTYHLGDLIQHTLSHSTHHRGQVTMMLRQLGHVPPCTDYRDFLDGNTR